MIRLIARISLGVVFLYAAYGKILYPEAFALSVYNYKILPDNLVNLTAVFLPWLEAVCGLALVCGVFTRGAAFIVSGLTLVFLAALGFNLYRGLNVECGCFGESPGDVDTPMFLARDAAIFILAVLVYVAHPRKRRRPGLY